MIEELPDVPQRDAIVKPGNDVLEGVLGPRQLDVGYVDPVAPKFVTQITLPKD